MLSFRRSVIGRRTRTVAVAALLVGGLALTPSPARAAGAPVQQPGADTLSWVTLTGEGGSVVADGVVGQWTDPAAIVVSGSTDSVLRVQVDTGDRATDLDLAFAPAAGEVLATGAYDEVDDLRDTSATGPRMAIEVGGVRCQSSGRFTVYDLDPEAGRVHLTYELHCDGRRPAVFGEIDLGVAAPSSGLVSVPARIDWPIDYPGIARARVPVTLRAIGPAGSEPGAAELTATGVVPEQPEGACDSPLPPGGSCRYDVALTPSGPATRTASLVWTTSDGAEATRTDLAARAFDDQAGFRQNADPDAGLGAGTGVDYTPASGQSFDAGGTADAFTLTAGEWTLRLTVPAGTPLAPGATYDIAAIDLELARSSRRCTADSGTLAVQEAVVDGDGVLRRFRATYDLTCGGAPGRILGSIAWHALTPPPAAPLIVDLSVDRARVTTGQRVALTVTTSPRRPDRALRIEATDARGTTVRLTGRTDATGVWTASDRVASRTTYRVLLDDGPLDERSTDTRTVTARAVLATTFGGGRLVDGVRVFRPGALAGVRVAVRPVPAGGSDCLAFTLQARTGGVWHTVRTRGCEPIGVDGSGTWEIRGARALQRTPLRVRASWSGDTEVLGARSPWRRLAFG